MDGASLRHKLRRNLLPAFKTFRFEIRWHDLDRKSTRLNSSHLVISYAVFCLKKKKNNHQTAPLSVQHLRQRRSTHPPRREMERLSSAHALIAVTCPRTVSQTRGLLHLHRLS